jgi:hypothetical protein
MLKGNKICKITGRAIVQWHVSKPLITITMEYSNKGSTLILRDIDLKLLGIFFD